DVWTDVSGSGIYGIRDASETRAWCGGAVGLEEFGQHELFPNMSLALPKGIFLICGDRAWQGVPKFPLGGPCYLGRLSLLAPSVKLLRAQNRTRSKRALDTLPATCNDSVTLIGKAENLLASIFCPGCVAAIANTNLQKLACWAAKQANLTSDVWTDLMKDVDSNRKAILQNRAAIDFLLLAHGHGCEDFDGMCCFNLSDHSKSIHARIQELQEHVNKIQVETGLDDLLKNLGVSGWLTPLIYSLLQLFLTRIVILCIGCGIF
ncbi:ENV2 protein, partial [Eolophus roseicapillus]|nr:ENV2 protein [Eolophus roseicapilla]